MVRKVTREHVEAALWGAGLTSERIVNHILDVVDNYVLCEKGGSPSPCVEEGHPPYFSEQGWEHFREQGGFVATIADKIARSALSPDAYAATLRIPDNATQICATCHDELPMTRFYMLGHGMPGARRASCKDCERRIRREKTLARRQKDEREQRGWME